MTCYPYARSKPGKKYDSEKKAWYRDGTREMHVPGSAATIHTPGSLPRGEGGRARRHRLNPKRRTVAQNRAAR